MRYITPNVGDFDLYIVFANRFNWTPTQVDEMDPDFITELGARLRAEDEQQRGKKRGK